jgi:hypothetical protein
MKANTSKSTYTLDLPNEPNHFPTFHLSQLRRFVPNNNELFPSCKLTQPSPVLTPDGEQEWLINRILDEHTWGRGWCHTSKLFWFSVVVLYILFMYFV